MYLIPHRAFQDIIVHRNNCLRLSGPIHPPQRGQIFPVRSKVIHRKSFSSTTTKMADTDENAQKEKKSYHTKATGAALATVKKHSKEHNLKLYGGCFW
jgi:hypothetical protein